MKKLKLDLKNVQEILTREQMKHIVGGAGSCAIYFYSSHASDPWYSTGPWSYTGAQSTHINTVTGSMKVIGISFVEVNNMLENTAGGTRRWCCDNCGSASWLE